LRGKYIAEGYIVNIHIANQLYKLVCINRLLRLLYYRFDSCSNICFRTFIFNNSQYISNFLLLCLITLS